MSRTHHQLIETFSQEKVLKSDPINEGPKNYFPELPPYSDPTSGFLSWLPSAWIPYGQAMRIDKPAGLYAFYFPYLIGTVYAACIASPTPDLLVVLKFAAFLLPVNILLRGAACTWNDNVDQEFDRQVKRCRHRPMARGAMSSRQGHIFTLAQIIALGPFLTQLPEQCTTHMAIATVLFLVYALAKRVTYYPQVVLGLPFAWAMFFCVAAFGMDPLRVQAKSTFALVGANILWTIVYDTIYAHQDIEDDEKAGVKGMAVRFRNSTKLLALFLITAQITLLVAVGKLADLSIIYYVGTVGGVAAAMLYHVYTVDLKKPESCGAYFHTQFWTVGAGFMAGFVGEYLSMISKT